MKSLTALLVSVLFAGPASSTGLLETEGSAESDVETAVPPSVSAPAREAAPAIARAAFATAILDREPVDSIDRLANDRERVFFFTEVSGLEGRRLVHRWKFEGEVMAEVAFDIGGPRWRVFSSKALLPGWLGHWEVVVVDEAGEVMDRRHFEYVAAEVAPPAAASKSPSPAR